MKRLFRNFFWFTVGACLFFLWASCQAQDNPNEKTILWAACKFNTDGTPCVPIGYRINFTGPTTKSVDAPLSPLVATTTGLKGGVYTVTMQTRGSGSISALTNPLTTTVTSVVVVAKTPGDTAASIFGVSSSRDFTILSPVGTIAVGTECDSTQQIIMSGTHYYIVPSLDKSIVWVDPANPRIRVYAICA